MTSRGAAKEVFVWIWLPGATEPVVAGRIARDEGRYLFNYGRSYLDRPGAIPIYLPELPLRRGVIPPADGLMLAGCLRDGAPDAWGRRVIVNRLHGTKGTRVDVESVDELTFLLESGSDRAGALDFQSSSRSYVPRTGGTATLDDLLTIAERVESGVSIPSGLEQAVFHGTSLGGARPKAIIESAGRKHIAKFSSANDITNVVKAEFVAMRLAAMAGLAVAPVELVRGAGKDVLLVERFDRSRTDNGWTRTPMVSALTLLGLDEMMARYASYQDLAEIIRIRFTEPRKALRELYGRLVFNVLCGNTDDHARNHAAFWTGKTLALTPAYDICPQNRQGREANQAMAIVGDKRASRLALCIEAAPQFLLARKTAIEAAELQIVSLRKNWTAVCDLAALTAVERDRLWRRQLLNPFAFDEAPEALLRAAGG